jgi:hypothetical protein
VFERERRGTTVYPRFPPQSTLAQEIEKVRERMTKELFFAWRAWRTSWTNYQT